MREDFLYYIWQHQLFRKGLTTTSGLAVQIIKPGFRNLNDGPDFKEAHVRIAGVEWFGAVEIHIRSSDWFLHGHQADPNYDAVILHVVYVHDEVVKTTGQEEIPTLSLKGAIKSHYYERYHTLIENPSLVACQHQLRTVPTIKRLAMAERVLVERLSRKSEEVLEELELVQGDWQEVTFRMLSKAMGFKSNSEAMLMLARRIPYKLLLKETKQERIEAVLLGMGGFLTAHCKDQEMQDAHQEFTYFLKKHPRLEVLPLAYWKFAPLRPQNQPTQRLVQLAAILHENKNLWELFLAQVSAAELRKLMSANITPYLQIRLRPGKRMKLPVKKVSAQTVQHLLINVTAPMLAAYAQQIDQYEFMERAVNLLSQLQAENNRITRLWHEMHWNVATAFDSQALNELYHQYCDPKRCLSCQIGLHLLNPDH